MGYWPTFGFTFWVNGSQSLFRAEKNRAKENYYPKNVPQLPAGLEVVSVYSTAFSWSHFPELVHNPASQSKYLTTTASSDKEIHGITSFCVSCYFFWTLLLLEQWDVSEILQWRDVEQLFPIYFSLSQFLAVISPLCILILHQVFLSIAHHILSNQRFENKVLKLSFHGIKWNVFEGLIAT